MKKMSMVVILAAAVALGFSGEGSVALAQSSCTGHARQMGTAVIGTPGDDFIDCSGSSLNMVIFGLGGDDFLIGGRGNDIINAGEGDDWVFSRGGNDILIGGPGNDALFAGFGADWVRGGDGNDVLFGGAGDDLLFGGKGLDSLFGARGTDLCDGQEGSEDWASVTCEIIVHVP